MHFLSNFSSLPWSAERQAALLHSPLAGSFSWEKRSVNFLWTSIQPIDQL